MSRNTFSLNGELDITLQKSKFFSSLRVKITAVVLIVLFIALVVINLIIIRMVGKSLIDQRVERHRADVTYAALEICGQIWDKQWPELTNYCYDLGRKYDCRVLVFDPSATVIVDNYNSLYGNRCDNKEINECLFRGSESSWGTYKIKAQHDTGFYSSFPVEQGDEYWAIYVASRIEYNNELIGALLISVPVQDLVNEVNEQAIFIIAISLTVGIMVSIILIFLLKRYFKPLNSMSRAIALMSKGDFSVRANAGKGQDELNELANAFNSMCAKMEILDVSRNKFVSDASHEMKTPLATMKILVDALINQSSEMDKAIYDEFLGDISHEIDRLTYLINDLLTLVRMDKKETTNEEFVPIQITDLLDKVRHKLQPLAAKRGISIDFHAEGDPTVLGNAMKLQQAFSNLVDNAIKYSTEDTTISISLIKDNKNAIITVADQGIGISPENLDRIFERFYRVDKARARDTGGTGLGLSIVDSIIKQHNGNISVESQQGKGTVFTVVLPMQVLKNRSD